MKHSLFIAAALLGLLLFGVQPDARAAGLADANRAMVDRQIMPGYRALAQSTKALDKTAEDFCAAPDGAGFNAMRSAFQHSMDAWQAVRYIRFGPVELFLRHHRFQIWPDRRNSVGKQLGKLMKAADPKVGDAQKFAQASVAVQGLSALERLLYGEGASAEFFEDGYRCRLLQAVTRNLGHMSAELVEAWEAGAAPYRDTLLRPGPDNPEFGDAGAVAGRLLNSLHTGLTEMQELKLGKPMGKAADKVRPRSAESWRSGRCLRNLRLNLAAARSLHDTGFAPLLVDKALRDRLGIAFDDLSQRLAGLSGDAITTLLETPAGWRQLQQLVESLDRLRRLISTELAPALGLPLGFNSLDGD